MRSAQNKVIYWLLPASVFILFSLCSLSRSEILYRRVIGEEKVFNHVFSAQTGELSTFPYCIAIEEESADPKGNLSVTEVTLTPEEYRKMLYERNMSALTVEMHFAVIKLSSVYEKEQTLALDVRLETEWVDCRLAWSPKDFNMITNITIMPERFRAAGLFNPTVYLREEMNQLASQGSEVEIRLLSTGRITVVREYSTSVACDLDLLMYPFDHHTCNFTFETTYSSLALNLTYNKASTVAEESWRLLARNRYVPNKLWEVVVLPARTSRRSKCSSSGQEDAEDLQCLTDRQIFRVILARHPTYQVINLFTPAFLCMLVSASIYLIPNGASDKTFLMLCILLSTFWFAISIYDKMPDTGSSLSWMGIYYFLCISVVSLNCIVCAISTTVSFSKVRVPTAVRKFVRYFAPALLKDMLVIRRKRKATVNHHEGAAELAEFYRTESNAETLKPCLYTDSDALCLCDITWLHVSVCLDRMYFVILLTFSICTLLVFILGGYNQPKSNYASHLGLDDLPYVEAQLNLYDDSDILHKIVND